MQEKLVRTIKANIMVSCFNESFAGMSIYLLIGTFGIPLYATAMKLSRMFGKFIAGWLEQRLAGLSNDEILDMSLLSEFCKSVMYGLGNATVLYNLNISMMLLGIAQVLGGVNDAFVSIYQLRASVALNPNVHDRSRFIGSLKLINSFTMVIGLLANMAAMAIGAYMKIDTQLVLAYIMAANAVLGVLDFLVTVRERRLTKEFLSKSDI